MIHIIVDTHSMEAKVIPAPNPDQVQAITDSEDYVLMTVEHGEGLKLIAKQYLDDGIEQVKEGRVVSDNNIVMVR